jgi:hypothetical protein
MVYPFSRKQVKTLSVSILAGVGWDNDSETISWKGNG